MKHYTDTEIREMFDQDWDLTIERLARITRRTNYEIRRILMER